MLFTVDTKIISKILEIHLVPHFLKFAEDNGYCIELTSKQNYYPDLTFIKKEDHSIKFAVDLIKDYLIYRNKPLSLLNESF